MEIRLCKATGVRWESLEHKEITDVNQRVYPTSNRRNPVDWDRVEAEVVYIRNGMRGIECRWNADST